MIGCHNEGRNAVIEIRQIKYLNNIVEQDHRAIKRLTRSMLGFKSFWSAAATFPGVKLMQILRRRRRQRERPMLMSALET